MEAPRSSNNTIGTNPTPDQVLHQNNRTSTGDVEPYTIRNAQQQTPLLYADRAPKKSRVSSTKGKAIDRDRLIKRTAEAWSQIVHGEEFTMRVGRASRQSPGEWFVACKKHFTAFSLAAVTQEGFQVILMIMQ